MTRRVLGTAVAVCLIGVVTLFVPAALTVRSRERLLDVVELKDQAITAARALSADPSGAATLPHLGERDDRDHTYAVYDAAGQRTAGNGPPAADRPVAAALRGVDASATIDDEIVVSVPLGPPGAVSGALRVAEPEQESISRSRATIVRLAGAAAAAVALSIAAGWLLVSRLLRSVRGLRDAAHRLGDGDFTVTVETSGIAELDAVGRDLTAAGHRIGRLVERERAFSADASHQLRTPVAALRVAFETELMAPRPDPALILEESLAALDRLEATVSDLLTLARDTPTDRGPLDLGTVAIGVAERWRRVLQRTGRDLHAEVTPTVAVRASAAAVEHILDVLLDNAFRHGAGAVTLTLGPTPGGVAVVVTDQGPGVAETGTLFQRRAPGTTGTGIGLSLARTLAEAEGGRLRLRHANPPTFELLFPADLDDGASSARDGGLRTPPG